MLKIFRHFKLSNQKCPKAMLRSLTRSFVPVLGSKAASTTTSVRPGTKYGGKTTVTLIPGMRYLLKHDCKRYLIQI